jgi:lipopolysaccharide/colanic/teichoic acid biosynthesis glycosyltransferase
VLPQKMYYNLKALEKFSFFRDIKIMFMTVFAMFGKAYKGDMPKFDQTTNVESEEKPIAENNND